MSKKLLLALALALGASPSWEGKAQASPWDDTAFTDLYDGWYFAHMDDPNSFATYCAGLAFEYAEYARRYDSSADWYAAWLYGSFATSDALQSYQKTGSVDAYLAYLYLKQGTTYAYDAYEYEDSVP